MYKAIVFDFFDVIRTDAYKVWLDRHGYKREGVFLETVEKMDLGEIKLPTFLDKLSEVSGQKPEAILAEMEEGALVDQVVVDIIEKLRKNYKIGLLSNAPSDFLRALLREHDLEKHFDEIVISGEVGLIKPSPEIFQLMLKGLSTQPSQTIFIDDNEKNVKGAEAVGITGVTYTNVEKLLKSFETLDIKVS